MFAPEIISDLVLLSLGIAILIKGSDMFIDSAVSAARSAGTSEHFIGITLVAIATSLPELATSVVASIRGSPDMALGNVLGSNVANIALVMGATLVFFPMVVSRNVLKDSIVMVASLLLVFIFMLTGGAIGRLEGLILLACYLIFMVHVYKRSDEAPVEYSKEEIPDKKIGTYVVLSLFLGLVIVLGANMAVHGAKGLADRAGISPLVIGGTLVALGTSLPELAASISAGLKKKHSIAIGNIIGSNVFNMLCVLGAASLAVPIVLETARLWSTMAFVLALSILVVIFAMGKTVRRTASIPLLASYVLFLLFLTGIL